MTQKKCTTCLETKPIEMFSLARNGQAARKPVRKSKCKTCQATAARQWFSENKERATATARKRNLAQYGLTVQQYENLWTSQKGECAICRKSELSIHGVQGTQFSLSVDHCHSTGRVRGLLCQKCNRAIGLLGDNIALLEEAIRYLSEGVE